MRKRLLLGSLVALILLAALAVPAAAQQERPGKLVLGGAYSLETGQRLNGDLGVAGGTATIQEGAAVQGDVIVLGGSLEVAGTITGDMAIFGGSVELANSAVVNGDVSYFGGSFDRAEGAVVTGQVRQGMELDFPGWRGIPLVPGSGAAATAPEPSLRTSPGQWLLGLVLRILRAIALTLALAGLALILSLFWPKGVQLIGQTAAEQPAIALLAGLLTWAIAGSAGILMTVTICLLPLALLLALVMVVAALVAWIATGWIVGRKLFAVLNVQSPTTVVEATTGTIILAAVYFLVSTVGCLAFVYGLLVASFGLGAIVLTRFGTRPYQPGAARSGATPPPAPASPALIEGATAEAPEDRRVATAAELGLPPAAGETARGSGPQPPAAAPQGEAGEPANGQGRE